MVKTFKISFEDSPGRYVINAPILRIADDGIHTEYTFEAARIEGVRIVDVFTGDIFKITKYAEGFDPELQRDTLFIVEEMEKCSET
jgi:hypothetical protein